MPQAAPHPEKTPVGISLLGHSGHGKATLAGAICETLAARQHGSQHSFCHIPAQPLEPFPQQLYLPMGFAEFETPARRYSLAYCAGPLSFEKAVLLGLAPVDCAILVVDATEGLTAQALQQVACAHKAGTSSFVVFLNKCDLATDEELLALAEDDLCGSLAALGLSGTPQVVRGAALPALQAPGGKWGDAVLALMHAVDACASSCPAVAMVEATEPLPAHKSFTAFVYVPTKEENRKGASLFGGHRPQFAFGTQRQTGEISLPPGTETINPGETADITVALPSPIPMQTGTRFTIHEAGRTIGFGMVTQTPQ